MIQKSAILVVALIVVIATAILLVWNMPKSGPLSVEQQKKFEEATSSMMPTQDPNIYKNNIYHFEFSYPFNLNFKEASPEAIIIGTINELETDSIAEVRVITQPLKNPKVRTPLPIEVILEESMKLCSASGPNVIVSCNKPEQQEIITTSHGLSANTFYLTEEIIDKKSGEIKSTILKGPFFSFDLSKNTPGSHSVILISPPIQKDPQFTNPQLIRDIADSLKITESASPVQSPNVTRR